MEHNCDTCNDGVSPETGRFPATGRSGRFGSRERTTVLVVGGMHSAACVTRIERALCGIGGVRSVGVNLLTRMATVRHTAALRPADLVEAIAAVGYQAAVAAPPTDSRARRRRGDAWETIASRRARFIAGAILTAALFFVQYLDLNERAKVLCLFLLATPVQLTVGWEFYVGFWRALRRAAFNMDTLVVLGSGAAYLQGVAAFVGKVLRDPVLGGWTPRFDAAALILTVLSFGRWLESRARESTNRLWGSLLEVIPRYARVLRDGREQTIPAGVVAPGDVVLVRPGETIPVDGEVIEGAGEVNESLMTGEDRPVPKVRGDHVLTACVNGVTPLRLRATGVGENSSPARIARLVEAARARKAPLELTADRAASFLVPLTLAVAAATFAAWYFGPMAVREGWLPERWTSSGLLATTYFEFLRQAPDFLRALVPTVAVLVVSCPYALGLAAPLATVVAAGVAARRGLLIRDGAALEAAAGATDVVFGKEGTLAGGTGALREVLTADETEPENVLGPAAALEACVARGARRVLISTARKLTGRSEKARDFSALPGRGLRGVVHGRPYLLGTRGLLRERGFELSGKLAEKTAAAAEAGLQVLVLADEERGPVGALAFEIELKPEAAQAVEELRALGLDVHLISGEGRPTARAVGTGCGISEEAIQADLGPEEKIDFLRQMRERKRRPLVVGDGIDDAPALAAADVGLVLGAGADLVAGAGDIVLVSDNPRGAARLVRLARETRRTIRWNLLWAFAFNTLMIPAAACNRLELWYAVVAAACSSILVVLNSLQLTYFPFEGPRGSAAATKPAEEKSAAPPAAPSAAASGG